VTWRLDDPAVAAAARARSRLPEKPTGSRGAPGIVPGARRLALPFPAGAPGIYRTDHEGTLRERKRFAATARALFAKGYEVDGVAVREEGPIYILTRR